MQDSILSAVKREIEEDYEPISRPSTVSFSADQSTGFCRWCKGIVEFKTGIEAATAYKTDLQDIRFLLERGEIHAIQPGQPILAICKGSLEQCFETRKTRILDSHFELKMQDSSTSGNTQ